MTKKFWKDWQNRIGETKDILINHVVFNKANTHTYYHHILSDYCGEDKILKATFKGDIVDLIIEKHGWGNGHHIVENDYLTLSRTEIDSIIFKNLWK